MCNHYLDPGWSAISEQQARNWNEYHFLPMARNGLYLSPNQLTPVQPLNPYNGPTHGVPAEVREHRSDCSIGLCRVTKDQLPPQLPLDQQVFEIDLHHLQQLSQTIQGRILELGDNFKQFLLFVRPLLLPSPNFEDKEENAQSFFSPFSSLYVALLFWYGSKVTTSLPLISCSNHQIPIKICWCVVLLHCNRIHEEQRF